MPRPAPPALLRDLLTAEREAGASFGAAWGRSLAPALRHAPGRDLDDWRAAFAATRAAWERAYLGADAARVGLALAGCATPADA